jgi:hypothetical protein
LNRFEGVWAPTTGWSGRPLDPGKHSIVIDFKYDGPGPGKGGTGVLTVDGKVLSQQKMEHTIPFLMSLDESFDIGMDTRTPVDETLGRVHTGFRSARVTSSNMATWVLSTHDSSVSPQTAQDA